MLNVSEYQAVPSSIPKRGDRTTVLERCKLSPGRSETAAPSAHCQAGSDLPCELRWPRICEAAPRANAIVTGDTDHRDFLTGEVRTYLQGHHCASRNWFGSFVKQIAKAIRRSAVTSDRYFLQLSRPEVFIVPDAQRNPFHLEEFVNPWSRKELGTRQYI